MVRYLFRQVRETKSVLDRVDGVTHLAACLFDLIHYLFGLGRNVLVGSLVILLCTFQIKYVLTLCRGIVRWIYPIDIFYVSSFFSHFASSLIVSTVFRGSGSVFFN